MKTAIRLSTAGLHLRTRDKRTGHLKMLRCGAPLYSRRGVRRAGPRRQGNVIYWRQGLRFLPYTGFRVSMHYRRNAWKARARNWRRAP